MALPEVVVVDDVPSRSFEEFEVPSIQVRSRKRSLYGRDQETGRLYLESKRESQSLRSSRSMERIRTIQEGSVVMRRKEPSPVST